MDDAPEGCSTARTRSRKPLVTGVDGTGVARAGLPPEDSGGGEIVGGEIEEGGVFLRPFRPFFFFGLSLLPPGVEGPACFRSVPRGGVPEHPASPAAAACFPFFPIYVCCSNNSSRAIVAQLWRARPKGDLNGSKRSCIFTENDL